MDTWVEIHLLTEFSIPAPLNVKQSSGKNGWLPCACAYVALFNVLTGENGENMIKA